MFLHKYGFFLLHIHGRKREITKYWEISIVFKPYNFTATILKEIVYKLWFNYRLFN